MDEELLRALQAYFINGGNGPTLYETGPAPQSDAPELDPFANNVYSTLAMPDVNSKGEAIPYGLDTQKSLLNYQQDMNQVFADPVNAYFASLFGGEGFAPGVFDPVLKETPISMVQAPMLQTMVGAGGYQGTLAKLMLPKTYGGLGMNPATAVSLLQKAVDHPEEASKLGIDPTMIEQIKGELPPMMDTSFGAPRIVEDQYDWQAVGKDAQTMWSPMAQETAQVFDATGQLRPGIVSRDGQFFSTEQVDSPQTEFLKKLGIPNPNARYDLEYAMENDPAIAGLFMHQAQTGTQADNMRKTFEQYTKKIAKQRDEAAKMREQDAETLRKYQTGPLAQWQGKMDQYGNAIKGSMADYFSQTTRNRPSVPEIRGVNPSTGAALTFEGQGGPQREYYPGGGRGGPIAAQYNQGWKGGPGEPDLPDFAWPGEMPERPQMSLYGNHPQMTADEVAQLFNASLDVLPKSMQGFAGSRNTKRMATKAQRSPLSKMATLANRGEREGATAMMRALVPYLARNAAGRTPAKDVIQQRLLPMYASGAIGQQGLPGTYPNRDAVIAAFGG